MSNFNYQTYGEYAGPGGADLSSMINMEGVGMLGSEENENLEGWNETPIDGPPDDKYCGNILIVIQLMYILAAILWVGLIYWCGLYQNSNILTWGLLLIPLLVFGMGYYNACNVNLEIEAYMLQSNYLSFGFLITIILLNWNSPLEATNKNKFFKLLITAFILIMLSMIDIWTDRQHLSVVIHFKSILQTAALVILSIALYAYYRAHVKCSTKDIKVEYDEQMELHF